MNRVLVWDLPTRVFHWLLAGGFIAAAIIALVFGQHSRLFPYHGIIGLVLALMVVLRLVWGVVGTRYARLRSLLFGPREVLEYLKGVCTGKGRRHVGHNPGSAYAILGLLALTLGQAATGVLLGRGFDAVEEVHEVMAYIMIGLVIVHVLGVVLHTIRHRENIIFSMIHGRKTAEAGAGIRTARPGALLAFVAIVAAWTVELMRNYEPRSQTVRVPLAGTALQFGEAEHAHDADDGD